MNPIHSVHIPVMGTAFTIDTPIKVAKYGISSVISLVDDTLIEEMRKYYCRLTSESYEPITKYQYDYRARRITAYLNLVDKIVKKKFEEVRSSCFDLGSEITKYFELLSNNSPLKRLYQEMLQSDDPNLKKELQTRLRSLMRPGDINVNIMTKLDRTNLTPDRLELPAEFSDALSALRGYALSKLNSAIVFSAGINRRLYSYIEKFEDFYADAKGFIKKKIILKVSDYRSSIIQGKFLAKKGLWVSEYRVESGLNCGGHAFASDGFLMGPILEEFKKKKDELIQSLQEIYNAALKEKSKSHFEAPHRVAITAQGGIGTVNENNFLLSYYNLDGTGWATPFLLVPEVTNVDEPTLKKLLAAGEKDVYLSEVSPLGVPFHYLKDNPCDMEKQRRIEKGRPGSPCPKGHLVSNTEFTEEPICTASRQYQKLKIDQINGLNLDKETYQVRFNAVVQKACICNDLGEAVILNHNLARDPDKHFPAICPGPNIAYFSRMATLEEMFGHIHGRLNLLNTTYRPNMFIKELKLYVEYFVKEVNKTTLVTSQQAAYLKEFRKNLLDGIEYYKTLFPKMLEETSEFRARALKELQQFKKSLEEFVASHDTIFKETTSNLVSA